MKDLEFYPVTLCSRWRSGQARPGLSQERKSERERREERRWGRCRKRVEGQSCCLFFFYLRECMCLFPFFFLMDSLLGRMWGSILIASPPSSFLFPLLSSFCLLSSPLLSSPPPAQLRLHLSPATEAPTPADPPTREGSRGQRREKVRVEGTKNHGKAIAALQCKALQVC